MSQQLQPQPLAHRLGAVLRQFHHLGHKHTACGRRVPVFSNCQQGLSYYCPQLERLSCGVMWLCLLQVAGQLMWRAHVGRRQQVHSCRSCSRHRGNPL